MTEVYWRDTKMPMMRIFHDGSAWYWDRWGYPIGYSDRDGRMFSDEDDTNEG